MKHAASVTAPELDTLYAAAVKGAGTHPNALGFMRRVKGSEHYRVPPRSQNGQPLDAGASQAELDRAAAHYRLAARVGRW